MQNNNDQFFFSALRSMRDNKFRVIWGNGY